MANRDRGIVAERVEAGFWQTPVTHVSVGQDAYKFLVDGERWLDDPGNPRKGHDGVGGLNSLFIVSDDGAVTAPKMRGK